MILIILIGILFVWMVYTYWSAPLMRENENGTWTTLRPERKISELFNKKQIEVDLNDQRLGMMFTKPKRKYNKRKTK
jgi:hypothetical protein